jgi:hypothetical protein
MWSTLSSPEEVAEVAAILVVTVVAAALEVIV